MCALWVLAWVRRPMALIGDAKQAMGEGKSGPIETGLTGRVATYNPVHEGQGLFCTITHFKRVFYLQ